MVFDEYRSAAKRQRTAGFFAIRTMASMSAAGHEFSASTLRAGSGLGSGGQWAEALGAALDAALTPLAASPPDLVVVFASAAYESQYATILAEVRRRTRATEIVGCSASAVIAGQRELEDQPGIALLALQLPEAASLATRYLRPGEADMRLVAHMPGASCNGLIVLADPFTLNVEVLVRGLERDYPGVPILGGLATGDPSVRETCVFHGTDVWTEGAVVVGLGGSVGVRPIVSQGCEPIGLPWTITDAEQNIIRTIGGRPAYQVLVETVQELDADYSRPSRPQPACWRRYERVPRRIQARRLPDPQPDWSGSGQWSNRGRGGGARGANHPVPNPRCACR